MATEVDTAILKLRAAFSGDILEKIDKKLANLGLTVAKTGKSYCC